MQVPINKTMGRVVGAVVDFGKIAIHIDCREGEAPAEPCDSATVVRSAGASPSQFHNRTRLHPVWLVAVADFSAGAVWKSCLPDCSSCALSRIH